MAGTFYWLAGLLRLFTLGGVGGIMLASRRLACMLHDGYFVVAHFHFVLSMGAIFGLRLALQLWWPQLLGYGLHGLLGASHF